MIRYGKVFGKTGFHKRVSPLFGSRTDCRHHEEGEGRKLTVNYTDGDMDEGNKEERWGVEMIFIIFELELRRTPIFRLRRTPHEICRTTQFCSMLLVVVLDDDPGL